MLNPIMAASAVMSFFIGTALFNRLFCGFTSPAADGAARHRG
jgi:polyferredoxin